jgi:hypothetical protein
MRLSFLRLSSATATLLLLGSSAAFACNPGDFQCNNGYRYICKCWTTTGCNYEPDSGYCHHDDVNAPPNLQSVLKKNIEQARLLCSASDATSRPGACSAEH